MKKAGVLGIVLTALASLSFLFGCTKTKTDSHLTPQATSHPDLTPQAKQFFTVWKEDGPEKLGGLFDKRSLPPDRELPLELKEKNDFLIKEVVEAKATGESDFVMRDTGERIHVQHVTVSLVSRDRGEFSPDTWKVCVAMDTKKVFSLVCGNSDGSK
jgi:hypothetical protein